MSVLSALKFRETSPQKFVSRTQLAYQHARISGFDLLAVPLKHNGCINTLSWTPDGRYLVSGSDDRIVKIWNTTSTFDDDGIKLEHSVKTGHRSNIFCAEMNPFDQTIVCSCAADGTLRKNIVGERFSEVSLLSSSSIIHMFAFDIEQPSVIYTAEEEGCISRIDTRAPTREVIYTNNIYGQPCSVKSVKQHPWLGSTQLFMGGQGFGVKQLDLRLLKANPGSHVQEYGPHFPSAQNGRPAVDMTLQPKEKVENQQYHVSLSGMDIGRCGRTLVASYQGDQIYTFPLGPATSEQSAAGGIGATRCFGGHRNYATFLKQVCFFGPNDDYVCSGSDSGHVWVWDCRSGYIPESSSDIREVDVVAMLKADEMTCNGVCPHPHLPILSSYGIDNTAKVWGYQKLPEDQTVNDAGQGVDYEQRVDAIDSVNEPAVVSEEDAASMALAEKQRKRRLMHRIKYFNDISSLPEVLQDSITVIDGGTRRSISVHDNISRTYHVYDALLFKRTAYAIRRLQRYRLISNPTFANLDIGPDYPIDVLQQIFFKEDPGWKEMTARFMSERLGRPISEKSHLENDCEYMSALYAAYLACIAKTVKDGGNAAFKLGDSATAMVFYRKAMRYVEFIERGPILVHDGLKRMHKRMEERCSRKQGIAETPAAVATDTPIAAQDVSVTAQPTSLSELAEVEAEPDVGNAAMDDEESPRESGPSNESEDSVGGDEDTNGGDNDEDREHSSEEDNVDDSEELSDGNDEDDGDDDLMPDHNLILDAMHAMEEDYSEDGSDEGSDDVGGDAYMLRLMRHVRRQAIRRRLQIGRVNYGGVEIGHSRGEDENNSNDDSSGSGGSDVSVEMHEESEISLRGDGDAFSVDSEPAAIPPLSPGTLEVAASDTAMAQPQSMHENLFVEGDTPPASAHRAAATPTTASPTTAAILEDSSLPLIQTESTATQAKSTDTETACDPTSTPSASLEDELWSVVIRGTNNELNLSLRSNILACMIQAKSFSHGVRVGQESLKCLADLGIEVDQKMYYRIGVCALGCKRYDYAVEVLALALSKATGAEWVTIDKKLKEARAGAAAETKRAARQYKRFFSE